jgi:hypothetical protein
MLLVHGGRIGGGGLLGLAGLVVVILAEDEPHHIGVLLDRARFAKVRQQGRLSSRCSTARLSCDSAITGTCSSLASCFKPRLISEISFTRLSPALPVPDSS